MVAASPSTTIGRWTSASAGWRGNEALFRDINEEIETIAFRLGNDDDHVYEFLCECANVDCDHRLRLSLDDYEGVRTNPVWFLVAPGHALPEIEDIVDRRGNYDVVEKRGEAARL